MGISRKYDTDEFKQEAVKLAESVGVSQAAREGSLLGYIRVKMWKPLEGVVPLMERESATAVAYL